MDPYKGANVQCNTDQCLIMPGAYQQRPMYRTIDG